MKKLISLVSFCFILFAFSACEKGDPGPQGPEGNANVKCQKFIIPPGLWGHYGTAGQPDEGFSVSLASDMITWDIVNSGAVLVYYSKDGNNFMGMPYTIPTGTGPTYQFSESWNFYYGVSSITFDVQDSDFFTEPPQSNTYFKVVAIAGSVYKSCPAIANMTYPALKAKLQLKD